MQPFDDKTLVHLPTKSSLKQLNQVMTFAFLIYGAMTLVLWMFFPVAMATQNLNAYFPAPPGGVLLILEGIAFACLYNTDAQNKIEKVGRASALLIVLMGALVLAHYHFGVPDVFDLLVPHAPGVVIDKARMPLLGAVYCLLFGSALMLVGRRWESFQPSASIALVITMLALIGIFSQVYQLRAFWNIVMPHYLINFPRLCIPFLSGIALLNLRNDHPLVSILLRDTAGGLLARRFVPLAILIPLLLGSLRLEGEQLGLYGAELGRAGLVLSMVLIFVVLIWWTSLLLDRVDEARLRTAKALSETERKRTEDMSRANVELVSLSEQLAESRDEAMDLANTKSEFLAKMSHEIRTPMNAVIGSSELLEDTSLTAEQQELVFHITNAGETLLDIIDNILCYSKLEAGKFKLDHLEFDLAHLIETTMELFATKASEKAFVMTTFVSPLLPSHVSGDPGRVREILINLIGNSVKFTQTGQIVLRVQPTSFKGKTYIRFSICDTGIGMSKETLANIFKPFVQGDITIGRNYGGSGLGLYICRRLIELMEGTIQVRSVLGRGSVFSFTIPCELDTPSLLNELQHDEDWRNSSEKVAALVVGNSVALTQELTRYLHCLKVPVKHAANLDDACSWLSNETQLCWTVFIVADSAVPAVLETIRQDISVSNIIILCRNRAEQDLTKTNFGQEASVMRAPLKRQKIINVLASGRNKGERGTRKRAARERVTAEKHHTILLVEDNAVNRKLAMMQLSQLGCNVHTAASGREAITAVTQERYALIFMDSQLPDIDGLITTAEIRKMEAEMALVRTPIVALTAQAMPGDREDCIAAGMDDYVSKPVTLAALSVVIERWLPKD